MKMGKATIQFESSVFYRAGIRKDYPLMVKGDGVYLFDNKGKQYMDISNGTGVANIGYGNEEVAEAMYEQATRLRKIWPRRL
jgi:4-aminobutyrate aminotransferase-like enzyme